MPTTTVAAIEDVGPDTVALELGAPPEFDAAPGQFVLVRATLGDGEEASYYTISSPDVADSFEITVDVPADETAEESLGAWLAERDTGDDVEIDGPFGDVQYRGDGDVVVFASGPGIGPAVGVAERAVASDHAATVVYCGTNPPHGDRLDALEERGVTVDIVTDLDATAASLDGVATGAVFVFGFDGFVRDVRALLEAAGHDPSKAAIESFGPA